MKEVTIVVSFNGGDQEFSATIHEPTSRNEFHLDPVEFYDKWGKSIPEIPHYEIEITMPGDDFFKKHVLHVHRSRLSNKWFICYPKRIATMAEAILVFRTWCLGTVVTVSEKIDLNTILGECDNDKSRMENVLHERFSIRITSQIIK